MSMSGLIPRLLPVCRELPRNEAITVREAQCEALTWQCVLRYYHNCCLYRPDKEESLADINRSGWSHRGQGVWSPPYHQMPSGKGVVSFIDSDVDPSPVSSLYQWAPHLCRTQLRCLWKEILSTGVYTWWRLGTMKFELLYTSWTRQYDVITL